MEGKGRQYTNCKWDFPREEKSGENEDHMNQSTNFTRMKKILNEIRTGEINEDKQAMDTVTDEEKENQQNYAD